MAHPDAASDRSLTMAAAPIKCHSVRSSEEAKMDVEAILNDVAWESVGGAATALALLVALVTYVGTARREKSIRRAELIRNYTADFYAGTEVPRLFMEIDYDRIRFSSTDATWIGGEGEATMVRMLDLFNSIGHNYSRGVVELSDIHGTTLGYAVLRAHDSVDVRRYLEHVKAWDVEHLGTGVPFQYFQELGNALRLRSARVRARNQSMPAVIATDTIQRTRQAAPRRSPRRVG
jgi:hypothetical protein